MSRPVEKLPPVTLDRLCEELERTGGPVVFEYRGKTYALITPENLEFFQELEDEDDMRAAREALKVPGEDKPYEEFRKELGLP